MMHMTRQIEAFVLFIVSAMIPHMLLADSAAEIDRDVEAALQRLYSSTPLAHDLSKTAKGILTFPDVIKAGLVIGGQYGEGSLRVSGKTIGYYNTVAASYGLQAGAQSFGYALLFMTEEALDYLFRRNEYQQPETSPKPSLILLDLRLPKIDGLEVLRQIKESESLRMIPVVVLTTSKAEGDKTMAYDHHVNSYLVKPLDFDTFTDLMDTLGFYWLGWNVTPAIVSEGE